ncbi:MAG: RNA polymerase sigma factor [Clostridia bacterium]|nr:RNA polymerase sigma factor [Clostridia bacterium]
MAEQEFYEIDRLVDTYADIILHLCYTYLHSTADAEDLCQNVLLKLIERTKPFESREHEKAWVIRTAINECKNELHTARRRILPLEEFAEIPMPSMS